MTTTTPTTPGRFRRPSRHNPDPVAPRDRRHSPKVQRPTRPVASRRVSSLPFLGLVAGLLAAGLLGLLLINNSLAAGSFEQARLRSDQILLGEQEQALRQEVERLSSPTRVREAAREAGLIPAATTAYFDVVTGQILGVPLPAGQVDAVTGLAPDAGAIDPATGQPIDVTTPLEVDSPATGAAPTDPTGTALDAAQPESSAPDAPPGHNEAGSSDAADGAVLGGEPAGATAYDRAIVSGGGR